MLLNDFVESHQIRSPYIRICRSAHDRFEPQSVATSVVMKGIMAGDQDSFVGINAGDIFFNVPIELIELSDIFVKLSDDLLMVIWE